MAQRERSCRSPGSVSAEILHLVRDVENLAPSICPSDKVISTHFAARRLEAAKYERRSVDLVDNERGKHAAAIVPTKFDADHRNVASVDRELSEVSVRDPFRSAFSTNESRSRADQANDAEGEGCPIERRIGHGSDRPQCSKQAQQHEQYSGKPWGTSDVHRS